MNEKKKINEIKRIIRTVFLITLIGMMIIYVVVLGKPVWEMLNLNVKAINVSSENDNNSFYYEGNRYQKIDVWSLHNLTFSTQKDECLGRIKGTFVVLYTLKNDPEHSILVGDAPTSLVVYSKEHSEIPNDGEITGVFLHATMLELGKKISTYAKEAIEWAVAVGVMAGKGENLEPLGNATRAEGAAMIRSFCENVR